MRELTDKQRETLEHVKRARGAGVKISDYARAQGIGVRSIYDSMVALRKKGLLKSQNTVGKDAFVAVRVKPVSASAPSGGLVCRLRVGAVLIECGQWPPASWVSALALGPADAAPR